MAEIFDHGLKFERNQCFVLNDQDIRGDLRRKLAARLFDELAQGGCIDVENSRGVLLGKSFNRDEKKCLARPGRDLTKVAFRRRGVFRGIRKNSRNRVT